ncbi:MAG: hypothetical protein QXW70_02140 [Candidatus Anstonellales archaeon]
MAKKRGGAKEVVSSKSVGVSESRFDFIVGIILATLGGLMTLQNMGLMPAPLTPWPIVLVIVGFGFIFKGAFE